MPRISEILLQRAHNDAKKLAQSAASQKLFPPTYDPETHYLEITHDPYFDALILVRHYIKRVSDHYFSDIIEAKNVDLFMLTPSISSPVGRGSDSESVPVQFGNQSIYLVDSSQFGLEPMLFQRNEALYCYLPSMRGEDHDDRHLNQFYHCEAEIVGNIVKLIPIVEGYITALAEICLALMPIINKMATDPSTTEKALQAIAESDTFAQYAFEDVFRVLLETPGHEQYVSKTLGGRRISSSGERVYAQSLATPIPFWIRDFDRDMTAFYQKPAPRNPDVVIATDLIFPPLTPDGFAGEVVGAGQRQDNPEEIYESLKRQGVESNPYEWYINLRRQKGYRPTSGFGLGIERFIAWMLGYKNIRDVIPYPRLKNVKTIP